VGDGNKWDDDPQKTGPNGYVNATSTGANPNDAARDTSTDNKLLLGLALGTDIVTGLTAQVEGYFYTSGNGYWQNFADKFADDATKTGDVKNKRVIYKNIGFKEKIAYNQLLDQKLDVGITLAEKFAPVSKYAFFPVASAVAPYTPSGNYVSDSALLGGAAGEVITLIDNEIDGVTDLYFQDGWDFILSPYVTYKLNEKWAAKVALDFNLLFGFTAFEAHTGSYTDKVDVAARSAVTLTLPEITYTFNDNVTVSGGLELGFSQKADTDQLAKDIAAIADKTGTNTSGNSVTVGWKANPVSIKVPLKLKVTFDSTK
jgi:hypothetical protein